MGDYGYDDENELQSEGLRALREADKAKAKEIKRLEALVTQQSEDLARFQAATRSQTVQSVLTAKGVNPKVAALIPSTVDPTEDAITAWLVEFGDVIGANPAKAATSDEVARATLPEETDPEETALRAAWAEVTKAADGQPPANIDQLVAGGLSKIAENTQSFEDAAKALAALPGFVVSDYMS